MAKKSSTNAVKKLDEQINELKKKTIENVDLKTPIVSKKELKDVVEKASKGAKKITSSKKKSTATKSKSTTKKTSTKTTDKKMSTKKTSKPVSVKKAIAKKSGGTKKKTASQKVANIKDDIIVTPQKKAPKKTADDNLRDDVVITPSKNIKKTDDENIRDKVIVTPKKVRKKSYDDDLKLDKPIDLDSIEEVDEYKIVEQFEDDIENSKYLEKAKILINKARDNKKKVKRRRKGKNKYVIDLESTKQYENLERDLRSLYDKTNDIIDDIDKTQDMGKPLKSVKLIEDLVVTDTQEVEKSGILDRISQKALNIFIIILLIIFIILLIGVISFIIFVSTF